MLGDAVRNDVAALIEAARQRPNDFPLAELTQLNWQGVDVSIERRNGEAIAFVENRIDPAFERLSRRGHEVAALVAAGSSKAQVGWALFVSLTTVNDRSHAIPSKTGLTSRRRCLRHGTAAARLRAKGLWSTEVWPCRQLARQRGADRQLPCIR
jgi:ATP/maltotriose-dependent transcriptional regulator MalT